MKNKSYPLAQKHVVNRSFVERLKIALFGAKEKKYQVRLNLFVGVQCQEQKICVSAVCKSEAIFQALNELKKRMKVEAYKASKENGFDKKWTVQVRLYVGKAFLGRNYSVTAFNKGEAFIKGEHALKSTIRITIKEVQQNNNVTLITEEAV